MCVVVPDLRRTWHFLAVDRLAVIPFHEMRGGPLQRRRRVCGGACPEEDVVVIPGCVDWLIIIPFREVCGSPLLGRRVVCGGRGVMGEEQCWSLFERHLLTLYQI